MNELTNDELMLLIVMVKNDISEIDKMVQIVGMSSSVKMIWENRHKLLAKLQIILEDRERIE